MQMKERGEQGRQQVQLMEQRKYQLDKKEEQQKQIKFERAREIKSINLDMVDQRNRKFSELRAKDSGFTESAKLLQDNLENSRIAEKQRRIEIANRALSSVYSASCEMDRKEAFRQLISQSDITMNREMTSREDFSHRIKQKSQKEVNDTLQFQIREKTERQKLTKIYNNEIGMEKIKESAILQEQEG